MSAAQVDLLWIPLGAGVGGTLVRASGWLYEAVTARIAGRVRCALYHSALTVGLAGITTTIEMAPVWVARGERGVVAEGPVGARRLGRSRLFRYEVRCWAGGVIPDAALAFGRPTRVSDDPEAAARILALVPAVPTLVWGRDELRAEDMWNSNSLVSWVLVRAGIDVTNIEPPPGGRAPGWHAGVIAASSSSGWTVHGALSDGASAEESPDEADDEDPHEDEQRSPGE